MKIDIAPKLPPLPAGRGRPLFEWHSSSGPLWASTQREGWTAAIRMVLREGQWVAAEYRVYPTTDGTEPGEWSEQPGDVPGMRGLSASLLRSIRFGELFDGAVVQLTNPSHPAHDEPIDWLNLLADGGITPSEVTGLPRRGRPGTPDIELARIAMGYDEAVRTGRRDPIQYITDLLDDPNPNRISQMVSRARRRGFLTDAPAKGVMGGTVTQKTIDTLKAARQHTEEEKE